MEVQPHQVQVGSFEGLANGLLRIACLDGNAELAVQDSRGGVDVSVGVHGGR